MKTVDEILDTDEKARREPMSDCHDLYEKHVAGSPIFERFQHKLFGRIEHPLQPRSSEQCDNFSKAVS